MNKLKIWFVSMLVIFTVAASYFIYHLGRDYSAYKYAALALRHETDEIKKENKLLQEQADEYSDDIESSNQDIEQNPDISKEIDEYYVKISDHQNKINELNKELSTLEESEKAIKGADIEVSGISNEAVGSSEEYKDITLACPAQIDAGRYRIEGKGFFRIVNIASNSVVESQNMEAVDSNSYTVNISNGQNVIIEGTLEFTPCN